MKQYFEEQLQLNKSFDEQDKETFLNNRLKTFASQNPTVEQVNELIKNLTLYLDSKIGQKRLNFMIRDTSNNLKLYTCFEDELETFLTNALGGSESIEYLDTDPSTKIPAFRMIEKEFQLMSEEEIQQLKDLASGENNERF